uniref:Uncharacterized protein n=2 Tax=Clytia hemisphaerica TaxID=252671 RepID=A0A7M5UNY0_9CNID
MDQQTLDNLLVSQHQLAKKLRALREDKASRHPDPMTLCDELKNIQSQFKINQSKIISFITEPTLTKKLSHDSGVILNHFQSLGSNFSARCGKSKSEILLRKVSTGNSVENVRKTMNSQKDNFIQDVKPDGSHNSGVIPTPPFLSINSPKKHMETVKKITFLEENNGPVLKKTSVENVTGSITAIANVSPKKNVDTSFTKNVDVVSEDNLERSEPSTGAGEISIREDASKEDCRQNTKSLVEIRTNDLNRIPTQLSTRITTDDRTLVKAIESLKIKLAQSEIKCQQHELKMASFSQTLAYKEEVIIELVKRHGLLRSKFQAEEKYLQETLSTKERHLNEIILKIRYESDMKQRELFDAWDKNGYLVQSLKKRDQQLLLEVQARENLEQSLDATQKDFRRSQEDLERALNSLNETENKCKKLEDEKKYLMEERDISINFDEWGASKTNLADYTKSHENMFLDIKNSIDTPPASKSFANTYLELRQSNNVKNKQALVPVEPTILPLKVPLVERGKTMEEFLAKKSFDRLDDCSKDVPMDSIERFNCKIVEKPTTKTMVRETCEPVIFPIRLSTSFENSLSTKERILVKESSTKTIKDNPVMENMATTRTNSYLQEPTKKAARSPSEPTILPLNISNSANSKPTDLLSLDDSSSVPNPNDGLVSSTSSTSNPSKVTKSRIGIREPTEPTILPLNLSVCQHNSQESLVTLQKNITCQDNVKNLSLKPSLDSNLDEDCYVAPKSSFVTTLCKESRKTNIKSKQMVLTPKEPVIKPLNITPSKSYQNHQDVLYEADCHVTPKISFNSTVTDKQFKSPSKNKNIVLAPTEPVIMPLNIKCNRPQPKVQRPINCHQPPKSRSFDFILSLEPLKVQRKIKKLVLTPSEPIIYPLNICRSATSSKVKPGLKIPSSESSDNDKDSNSDNSLDKTIETNMLNIRFDGAFNGKSSIVETTNNNSYDNMDVDMIISTECSNKNREPNMELVKFEKKSLLTRITNKVIQTFICLLFCPFQIIYDIMRITEQVFFKGFNDSETQKKAAKSPSEPTILPLNISNSANSKPTDLLALDDSSSAPSPSDGLVSATPSTSISTKLTKSRVGIREPSEPTILPLNFPVCQYNSQDSLVTLQKNITCQDNVKNLSPKPSLDSNLDEDCYVAPKSSFVTTLCKESRKTNIKSKQMVLTLKEPVIKPLNITPSKSYRKHQDVLYEADCHITPKTSFNSTVTDKQFKSPSKNKNIVLAPTEPVIMPLNIKCNRPQPKVQRPINCHQPPKSRSFDSILSLEPLKVQRKNKKLVLTPSEPIIYPLNICRSATSSKVKPGLKIPSSESSDNDKDSNSDNSLDKTIETNYAQHQI